ncbi:MAG: hypothetical protein IPN76_19720 [Saprospiraceae bacterium]|nr:hypothetical protein [Saprospiraceae bacterium]
MNDLIETYRKGDLDAIRGMVNERFPNENYRQELLTNRNVRMVERMIGLGKQQSIFCAGHGAARRRWHVGLAAQQRVQSAQGASLVHGRGRQPFEANKPIPKQLTFMDEERGFSAHLPAEPQVHWARQQLDEGNTMTTKLYIAMDLRSGREYTIAVFDYPPSLVFTDKQAVFNTAIENYERQWGPQIGESRTVYVDGFGRASKYRTRGAISTCKALVRAPVLHLRHHAVQHQRFIEPGIFQVSSAASFKAVARAAYRASRNRLHAGFAQRLSFFLKRGYQCGGDNL